MAIAKRLNSISMRIACDSNMLISVTGYDECLFVVECNADIEKHRDMSAEQCIGRVMSRRITSIEVAMAITDNDLFVVIDAGAQAFWEC